MRKCKAVKLAVRLDSDVDLLPILSHLNPVILFKIYFIDIHASAPHFSTRMSYTPFRASRQAVCLPNFPPSALRVPPVSFL